MTFKTNLSWIGWCLLVPLLILDVGSLALLGSAFWEQLSQSMGLGSPAAVPDFGTDEATRRELLAQLPYLLILLNLTVLPLLLLTLRFRRTMEY